MLFSSPLFFLSLIISAGAHPVHEPAPEVTPEPRPLSLVEQDLLRSHANLGILAEMHSAEVELWHVNELGRAYTLESVQYFVDGESVFSRGSDTAPLDDMRTMMFLNRRMSLGSHRLEVSMVLRGKLIGTITYLDDYRISVTSSYTFEVNAGERTVVRAGPQMRRGAGYLNRVKVGYESKAQAL